MYAWTPRLFPQDNEFWKSEQLVSAFSARFHVRETRQHDRMHTSASTGLLSAAHTSTAHTIHQRMAEQLVQDEHWVRYTQIKTDHWLIWS
jgi:hypothetical protein